VTLAEIARLDKQLTTDGVDTDLVEIYVSHDGEDNWTPSILKLERRYDEEKGVFEPPAITLELS
jgi:hypothetical protein